MNLRSLSRATTILVLFLCVPLLAACALFGIDPERIGILGSADATRPLAASVLAEEPKPAKPTVAARPERRPYAAKAGGSACVEGPDCVARLKRLVTNADRSWIGKPEPLPSFADGTRLFAYRALRTKLSCRELGLALAEVKSSTKLLLQPASGVARERAEKATHLAGAVAAELGSELESRCPSPSTSARVDAAHSQ